jgi:hypothetical protein
MVLVVVRLGGCSARRTTVLHVPFADAAAVLDADTRRGGDGSTVRVA